ncbi:winged helix-turn-helix domain-containing protein [Pseudoalteromonas denitrificans]|uniref:DNA-binding winged helix-turn-helix (WHTH) domain-containing protein n=1 Tax=Pseudoalteromonas denitrificans DSM 6059 TaxID=1123010 RepID=A0A1I1TUN6_9GAMM|nr:winged helix-turn-helix domain-containing protein [Pseudoalteromonas denitrificans]SFD59250.1 DNA-binding winged helix-turn-helix (wHTH) domain-containing protein [Pseudoalteromonas denitrificans DSM 6059]
MLYLLGDIQLDLHSGWIIKNDKKTNIRAKTLLVLKYLTENKNDVVTKQALLDHVWHGVVVQEQVLVQSIKEIRDLLGSDVIKTYPKKGYQWTAQITPYKKSEPFIIKLKKYKITFSILIIIFALILFLFVYLNSLQNQKHALNITFLPVKNDMPDKIHAWVPIEGMDYLIKNLSHQTGFNVIETDDVLHAISRIDTFNKMSDEAQVNQIRKTTGADIIIHTRLLGYPQDFQLHYIIYSNHSVERGVAFSSSITEAFDQIVKKVTERFSDYKPQAKLSYQSDFSNEAFVNGMALYLQRDYIKAIPFFTSALHSNPKLLAAKRYLAASFANSGQVEQGIKLLRENISSAQKNNDIREEIRDYLLIGYLLINWHEDAMTPQIHIESAKSYIEKARTLAERVQDKLFIAYTYEELGKIYRLKQQYPQAIKLLKSALLYHQSFKGSYGQTTALIELALVADKLGDYQESQTYFSKAMKIANKNGVATNKVWILLAKANLMQLKGNFKKVEDLTYEAMKIAQESKSKHLIYRVNAWLDKNPIYEVN